MLNASSNIVMFIRLNFNDFMRFLAFSCFKVSICLLVQIPVILNAVGGILVGLLTTYAGGVRKVS